MVEIGLVSAEELEGLPSDTQSEATGARLKALRTIATERGRVIAHLLHHGRLLWKSIDKIVFLTQIKRQESDPAWASMLNRIRNGDLTASDYRTLNTRVLKSDTVSHVLADDEPFIVIRNEIRMELNNRAVFKYAADRNQQVVAIQSHDRIKGIMPLALDTKRKTGPDNESNGQPHVLYLTKNAPVIMTKNKFVELGVTNGNVARLTSIKMSERDERDAAAYYQTEPLKPYFLKDLPEYLTLDMRDDTGSVRHQPIANLEPWELPIFPYTTSVTAEATVDGKKLRKTFSRKQFHLCLAFALTDYKVQGKSYERAIVDLVKPRHGRNNINSLYVMLSRVKTLDGLRILRKFRFEDINLQLSKNYINEMRRLEQFVVR